MQSFSKNYMSAMHIDKYQSMMKTQANDFQLPQWSLSVLMYAI